MKSLVGSLKTIAIICNQWGDTGKGKFVDYFTSWAEIVARGTGGANAGHTLVIGDKKYIFHLLPSGIIHDKINIIGSGVAFDPRVALDEMKVLDKNRINYEKLKISYNAKLVLPQHLVIDRLKEQLRQKKIGTTGRGIGPVYSDHITRQGLIVNDMLNPKIFKEKLRKNLVEKVSFLKGFKIEDIEKIMMHEHLLKGVYFESENIFNVEKILNDYIDYGKVFQKYISDTDEFIRENKGKRNILLEGAQGILLSVDFGGHPYVTSSDASVEGLAKGVGLTKSDVELTLGITKAFYMTRVGEGPFPTEIGGKQSGKWCGDHTENDENLKFPYASVNDNDEFIQGIGIRKAGFEYGATTGRPRRTGWLDLPLLKYATKINGNKIVLTKLDVLDNCKIIKICTSYKYIGDDYNLGNKLLRAGDILNIAYLQKEILENCEPIYKEFKGWDTDTTSIKNYLDLPKNLRDIIEFIECFANVKVLIASVGPEREQTIIRI